MPDDHLLEMPFLRNIGLLLTYQCQVACPHCIIQAGPHRTEAMPLADALAWIEQISVYRGGYIKVLSLTGGEPFFNLSILRQIADAGAAGGLIVSAVTNAFWATSLARAVTVLREQPAIRMLAISADVYHQKFIPFERVRNAVLAAQACELPYNVHVCTTNEADPGYRDILHQLHKITEPDTINTAVTFPAGRALEQLGLDGYATTTDPPISACTAGSSPIIFPDGKVIACIGSVIDLKSDHPLVLGNLHDEPLADILDRAETNPILHTIRVWGPRRLIALARQAGLAEHLPDHYLKDSVCYACYHLMASPEIVAFLRDLAVDEAFQQKVAYARVFYLHETRMAERVIGSGPRETAR